MAVSMAAGLSNNLHARRFVKFCIVGASSTTIQMVTLRVFLWLMGSNADTTVQIGNALGVALAIVNGFYWNRRWTFRKGHTLGAARQFRTFVMVSLVGFGLNNALFGLFYVKLRLFPQIAELGGKELQANACQLLAIAFVVIWNFTANTRWTFNVD